MIDPADANGVTTDLIRNNGMLQVYAGDVLNFSLIASEHSTSTERFVLPDGGVRTTVSQEGIGLDAYIFLLEESAQLQSVDRGAGSRKPVVSQRETLLA